MRPFSYASPDTLDAARSLQTGSDDARFLAGGTDLLTLLKADLLEPSLLIDIKRLAELDDAITLTDGRLRIGALATLADLETHPLIAQHAPAVAEAAALAATPQLRNMATTAGNLLQRPRCWYFRDPEIPCWLKGGDSCPARDGENQLHAIFEQSPCVAVHPSDPAAALLAHDATVEVRGESGSHSLPLADLFAPPTDARPTETRLLPGDVITALSLPVAEGSRSVYLKAMDRKTWAFALVGVAARTRLEGGRIAEARVVLSGVANTPWRASAAEEALTGQIPTPDVLDAAAEAALEGAEPLAKNGYKLPLTRALVRRALEATLG
ncbi:MAG: FAD binding domain-containing protein [Thermomicrobiales bacterium]